MQKGVVDVPVSDSCTQAALEERLSQLQTAQAQVYRGEAMLCVLSEGG